MENDLLGIGRVSALSGLPVSALRFYDGAGVLTPATVDPSSGYRLYGPEQVRAARLIAHLRRVGLPLRDIRAVLVDPAQARSVLDAHLGRLEAGLADARREISIVQDILDTQENPMHHATVPGTQLRDALKSIRYAIGTDPDEPRLNGVYLDSDGPRLRLVATDRFRLATVTIATSEPTDLHLLLPRPAVDKLLTHDLREQVEVTTDGTTITFTCGQVNVTSPVPDLDFPSYRALLEHGRRPVTVDARQLRADLATGPTLSEATDGQQVTLLAIDDHGVRVAAQDTIGDVVVAVNRDYLLQALAAADQLTLAIDDPIAPLAIRDLHRDGAMSVLMPVHLGQPR